MSTTTSSFKTIYATSFCTHGYNSNFSVVGVLNGKKYKITSNGGNRYSNTKVYLLTDNGWQEIANNFDIEDVEGIDYLSDNKTKELQHNLDACIKYIETVFGE